MPRGGYIVRSAFALLTCFALCLGGGGCAAQAETRADQDRLFAATLREPTNYDLTFQYVQVSIALSDYEAAIGALERLLFYNPDLTRAKFELGMLYFRMGSYENALRYFKEAEAAPDLDPDLRARLAVYLPDTEKQLQPSRWSGFLQTGVSYQSNVSALPEGGAISVFGTSLPLGANTPQKSDGDVFGLVRLSNDYDLQNQRGDTIETRFIGYGTAQFVLSQFDLGYAEASIGPRLALNPEAWPGVSVKPYVVGNLSWIGGTSYLNSGGAGVALRVQPSSVWSIEPDFEWRRVSVNNPGAVEVTALGSGDFYSFSVAAIYKFTDIVSLEVQPILARAAADNSWQSFDQGGLTAGLRLELAPPFTWMPRNWMVMPYMSLLWDSFDTPDPAVEPSVRRRDIAGYGGVLLDMPITANLGVSGMLQYARTDSNISNFKYDNFTVMFGPTARF